MAFDDDLAEFDRDRQRHAQAARAAGEDFALHPGIDGLIARGRALVETAPRPEEIPRDLPPFLDLVAATRREHDEAVARADAEILARLDRAERELDAVKAARRALRNLAKGGPLHAVAGYAAWRERAGAAIDALQSAVVRDGEREQRGLDDTRHLAEAFDHDDEVAALIADWTAFEDEARARGVEAVDLASSDPLLARIHHLAGNPPEGETLLRALAGILARRQARSEEREKAAATITRSLDGYRACQQDTASPLSAIGEWRARTKAAIDTWRAMTVVDERDPALSATATVLEDIIAFEERAHDVTVRLRNARGDDGTANPFLEVDGDALAADLRALEASLPRHGDLLSSLREASQALDRHEARIAERDEADASLAQALEDYRACHGPTDDTAGQLSDIRTWCLETRNAIDAWRAMTEADERTPAASETAAALEDLMAFEERARDVLTRWRIASIGKDGSQRFLGPEGEALATDLKALEAGLPRHAIMLHDLRPALEQLAGHERAVDRARELFARAREVDDARRFLLEREGKSSRPLDRRFNRAWKRWREAAEAVVADIKATDAALIAHVDDTAVASRVRNAYAASDRLDSLPGWLLLRLHDNAANAGSAMHPAMTKDYAGIVSDMQRLDAGLRENDPRRVVLRSEINAYQALDQTRRTVARLLADLKAHDAEVT
ncbi:MAG: hypothetical protein OXQ28_02880 [Acidobacteriota bacterium]|nr:hypothetical protein [Acidobacteriota bacterium]